MKSKVMLTNEQAALKVSAISILCNLGLSALKMFAGVVAHSSAMISDAINSISDVLNTLIVIAGIKVSRRIADKEHQYGHERFECVATIILAVILFATGVGVGWTGLNSIIAFANGSVSELSVPGVLAIVAAIISIAVKECMYWYTRREAKRLDSVALMAGAWDNRSDALSSFGGLVGIVGARLGLPILDPIAGIIICGFILFAAIKIFKESITKMTDRSADEETQDKIRGFITSAPGVLRLDDMKTRVFNSQIYVDIEISADSALSLIESHSIAETLHDALEIEFPKIKHCTVHVNPG